MRKKGRKNVFLGLQRVVLPGTVEFIKMEDQLKNNGCLGKEWSWKTVTQKGLIWSFKKCQEKRTFTVQE